MAVTASKGSRPNIILFVADEMRADSLACYGNPLTRTPNFDRLAAEGTLFADCHVQFPVCAASRCSLVTGWPASVRGHRSLYYLLRPEEPNLFRYLKESGYDVLWFGRNDVLATQTFYGSVTRWTNERPSFRGYVPVPTPEAPGATTFLAEPKGDRRDSWDYAMVRSAIEVLQRKETERPFCIFLPILQPHPPYTAPADFYHLYKPSEIAPLAPPDLPRKPSFHRGIRQRYGLNAVHDETFRRVRAVYLGQVSYCDWLLGELLDAIDRTDHRQDTALFAFSDHGDYAGDYGLVEKWPSGLEDALTHVPLLARVPDGVAGHAVSNMVELFDVMATCLELAGAPARHTHFARSLLPQLHGGVGDADRAAFAEGGYNTSEPQCFEPRNSVSGLYTGKVSLQNDHPETVSRSAMIRTPTHKLIARPQGQSELYDIASDRLEQKNLFGDTSVATIQAALQQRLLDRYIDVSGVAPFDRDPRDLPPYYPIASFGSSGPAK